jgi:hypothetical protein
MRIVLLMCAALAACGSDRTVVAVPVTLSSAVVDPGAVKSFELWVLEQVGRDGTPILCDDLLARTIVPAAPNAIVIMHVAGSLDGAAVALKKLPVGQQNRIFYVDMYSDADELGERVGAGCSPSVSIVGGKNVTVEITIDQH